jgi:UDP-glucose 4-epimerase
MNIVLTGQKGLIGNFLKKRLIKEGNKIVDEWDLKEGKNIIDMQNALLNKKADMLIHMAAHCKINQSITNPEKTFEADVLGTFNVFEFARKNKIPKIVYFSSSRILSPEKNPYIAAKIYGEELCKGYKDAYGMNYIIIRPSTVYGPVWDKTKRLMHIFITNALENKPLEIYGNPKTKTLDFTYVEDFVEGVMLAINGPENKEYNISGGEEKKVKDLAEFIIKETNSKSKILFKKSEIAQPQKVSLDLSSIKKLGYSPRVPLTEGVKRNIEFCKKYLVK